MITVDDLRNANHTRHVRKIMEQSEGSLQNRDRRLIIHEKNLIRQKIRSSLKKEKEAKTTLSELLSQLEVAEREKNRLLQDRFALEKRGNVIQQQKSNNIISSDTLTRTIHDAWNDAKMRLTIESISNFKSNIDEVSKLPRSGTSERKSNVASERHPEPSCYKNKTLPSVMDPKTLTGEETTQGLKVVRDYLKVSDTTAKNQKNTIFLDGINSNSFLDNALNLELAIAERLALKRCIVKVFPSYI